jgi:2-oxo-4-hydroxy-4-carboxy-5-ureidoimidazoline decarboxylase
MGERVSLVKLNRLDLDGFATALGDTFEFAPWVAKAAYARRPFATVAALHEAMMAVFRAAPRADQLAFLHRQTALSRRAETHESEVEHRHAGLETLGPRLAARYREMNDGYIAKFGYPFYIAVRRYSLAMNFAELERRLAHDPEAEFAVAVRELFFVTRLRICAHIAGEGMPRVDGQLTTHVLDTDAGRPAVGLAIALYEEAGGRYHRLTTASTNADGRTDQPLISGRPLPIGRYELRFAVGDHFRRRGIEGGDPPFLDVVPLRFSIAEPEGHYHVPLLCSPWSYSTYRGS